jgi:hypothetical protein
MGGCIRIITLQQRLGKKSIEVISRKFAKVTISNEEVPGSSPGQSYFCLAFCCSTLALIAPKM